MSDNIIRFPLVKLRETTDHLAGSVTEQGRLNIIPGAMQRVKFVGFPEFGKDLVFSCQQVRKVHEDHQRLPLDVPPSCPYLQPLFGGLYLPLHKKSMVFQKIGIFRSLFPHVGAYQYVIIVVFVNNAFRFGGQHSVDTAYFVTNLPACLEYIIGLHI